MSTMPKEYKITLTSGDYYILAHDSESAAWAGLELSKERDDQLINVQLSPEW